MATETLLEVNNVKKYFPIQRGLLRRTVGHVRAVDGVDMRVNVGETLGLVGESGCGKTTTGRLILRAIDPTEGQILFRKEEGMVDIATMSNSQLKTLRREMQIIFQDPFSSLNPRMTVFDLISEPLVIHGENHREVLHNRVRDLLEMVGLRS